MKTRDPAIETSGDRALLVRFGREISSESGREVLRLMRLLEENPPAEIVNVQPAYSSVLLGFDPLRTEPEALAAKVAALLRGAAVRLPAAKTVEIPVCYDEDLAPDLADVAARAGTTPEKAAALHAGGKYRVCFLGFMPGFAYLAGLPKPLAAPRLDSPRRQVPAGSVGLAGGQTGVYPFAVPGGWRLIGRAPLKMFDARRQKMSLLSPGDEVRFRAVARAEYEKLASLEEPRPERKHGSPAITVLEPGMFTTVQDLGRPGHGAFGISPCGAADSWSLRLGNRLAGNHDGAASLEMTLLGGMFRFERDAVVAVSGADFSPRLDGVPVTPDAAQAVRAGQTLSFGHTSGGARAYLCVRGGIDVPLFLGSASTHALSGLGGLDGRALKAGDVLSVGIPTAASGPESLAPLSPRKTLRVVLGPDADLFSKAAIDQFLSRSYEVTQRCDRLGLRLAGAPLARRPSAELASAGVALGTVQISPDGLPMILFVDQQTTGGYPQIACVASVDHPALGQLVPGDEVRFEAVSVGEALRLLRARERLLP